MMKSIAFRSLFFLNLLFLSACLQLPSEEAPSPSPGAVLLTPPTSTPTPTPSLAPTSTPTPTRAPTSTPTPTRTPTVNPTATPTPAPTSGNPVTTPGVGATTSLSFTAIPYTDNDWAAPGRGAELWHTDWESTEIPVDGQPFQTLDAYYRFSWWQIEKGNGVYDFTFFDQQLNDAIDHGRKFSFGLMSLCTGCENNLTGNFTYPSYLHEQMQSETPKDWKSPSGDWVPNWNSPSYLSAYERLLQAIAKHIANGSYKGISYSKVIGYVDVRGYGSWGEWHFGSLGIDNLSGYPSGTAPTDASLIRILDAHVTAFPKFQLVNMIGSFEGGATHFGILVTSPAVGYHALKLKNDIGLAGWRRDSWGALDTYLRSMTDQNGTIYQNMLFKTEIMNRWQFAPIVGEPMNGGAADGTTGSCAYSDLENQVKLYHMASFGNGNFYGYNTTPCQKTNLRNASKRTGYRLVLNGGYRTSAVSALDRKLTIQLLWRNIGITPSYENWDVTFELVSAAKSVVWSGKSAHLLKLYLPDVVDKSVTDTFVLPGGVAAGNYTLRLVIKDPNGYRAPLPLAIQGRDSVSGSYPLGTVSVP